MFALSISIYFTVEMQGQGKALWKETNEVR